MENIAKKLILIGQSGSGKSATVNKLLKRSAFDIGHSPTDGTKSIQSASSNQYSIIDCPGFGNSLSPLCFHVEYITKKDTILNNLPIDGIIFLVKFENGKSETFLKAAQDFYSVFGRDAFKSLMILCIQESKKKTLSEANFETKLYGSDGYKYLVEKNDHQNIQYCLWDNYLSCDQYEKNFKESLSKLEKFDLRQFEVSIKNAKAETDKKNLFIEKFKNTRLFTCLNSVNKLIFFFIVALLIVPLNHGPTLKMAKLDLLKDKSAYSIDFNQLKKDYDGFSKEDEKYLLNSANEIVLQKSKELLNEMNNFPKSDIEGYISKLNKLLEISNHFSNQIPSLKTNYEIKIDKLLDLFSVKIQNFNSLLAAKSTDMKQINSDYDSLQKIAKYLDTSKDKRLEISNELLENLKSLVIKNYLKSQNSLTDFNETLEIEQIVESIKFVESYSVFIQKISNDSLESRKSLTYEEIISKFSAKLSIYLKELSSFSHLVYDHNNNLEANFDQHYEKLNNKFFIINLLKENLESYLGGIDFNEFLFTLVDRVRTDLDFFNRDLYDRFDIMLKSSQLGQLNDLAMNEFNTELYNLRSFDSKFDNKKAIKYKLKFDSSMKIKVVFLEKLNERLNKLAEKIEEKDVDSAAKIFIQIRKISNNLLIYKDEIDQYLDDSLNRYIKKNGFTSICRLALALKSEPVGAVIVDEHKCFWSFNRFIFAKNLSSVNVDLDSVLGDLDGDSVDKNKLKTEYQKYDSIYKSLIKNYLKKNINFNGFISNLTKIVDRVKIDTDKGGLTKIDWDSRINDELSNIIAHLFGLFTLLNSENYFLDKTSLFTPHAAQVIAIFRMLGLGYNDGFLVSVKKMLTVTGLRNNFVEIGTGEGKSITLGITAATLALLGLDVNCVSYSRYLSERDHTAFSDLFKKLKIDKRIQYGTFNMICEQSINQHGDLRSLARNIIFGNSSKSSIKSNDKKSGRPVLLIDEVDVFFSHDYYGNSYNPIFLLQDVTITKLIEFIWTNRKSVNDLNVVKKSQEYKNCVKSFKKWESIIELYTIEVIKGFKDYSNFTINYIIKDDKIGYKIQDQYVFYKSYGYFTLAAYFLEHEKGKISKKSLYDQIGFGVHLGSYSFAEILKSNFYAILGATGTLKTLSDGQKNIIEYEYNIKHKTYMPSIYGRKNVRFDKKEDVLIEKDESHFKAIVREIEKRLKGKNLGTKRAVFVVFENNDVLMRFRNSDEFAHLRLDSSILNEEATNNEKKVIINSSTMSGRITLFTRIFGRGTDFIVFDEIVSANGGVHVIQTFLSEELSEEIQIIGRTGRQAEDGSYSLILAKSSLDKFEIRDHELDFYSGRRYDLLNMKRNEFFRLEYLKNTKNIDAVRRKHENSMEFIDHILNNNTKKIEQFFLKESI